jgi:hypothetical protein
VTGEHNWCRFGFGSEVNIGPISDAISVALYAAPRHLSETDTRGVSDPAGGLGAAFATRRRGRSRPILAAAPVLGRLRAAQTAARPGSVRTASTSARSMACGVTAIAVALDSDASREIGATARGGANRALA